MQRNIENYTQKYSNQGFDTQNAFVLFLKQKRFDLIFKYLYVKYPHNNFVKQAYLENIRAFNGFFEENPSDNIPKQSPQDFFNSFDKLILSIRANGFMATNNYTPPPYWQKQ